MATRLDVQLPWMPDDILVRVVEGVEAGIPALAPPNRPEAGVYAPSFNLWDGAPVLDLLFKATDRPKQKGWMAPVLLLNLVLPKDESSQRPL
jgi:hypothetical protein